MNPFSPLCRCVRWLAGVALLAGGIGLRAQIVELRATITAAQEVPATPSPATGTGIMLYNVATNTFDLFVTLERYGNVMTDSHVQEAPAGANGPALIHFGAESVFTRNGSSVTAAFLNRRYPGDPRKLLRSGAYLNFHSPQFPLGEIRGQLIARPKRLVALITAAQEQAAFPGTTITSPASGAAEMTYDPAKDRIALRVNLYGFTNTLTNSHYHEGPPGVSGPVAVALGAGTAGGYVNRGNGHWEGSFDLPYTGGDPLRLLTGGAYLNFHSNVFPNGEIRGQVTASDETPGSRIALLSLRGFAGPGAQTLIGGLTITGPEPIRVLITAKGPSLTAFGLTGVLADPILAIHDFAGRQVAANDNIGAVAAGSELARVPGVPTNPTECALLLVLPPGTYSVLVSGANNSSGLALVEAADLRAFGDRVIP